MAVYTEIPRQLVTLINGIVVLFIAANSLIKTKFLRLVAGKEAEFDDAETNYVDVDPPTVDAKE